MPTYPALQPNQIAGIIVLILSSHIAIHEVVICIRCIINATNGIVPSGLTTTNPWDIAWASLSSLMTLDTNSLLRGIAYSAQAVASTLQYDRIIRFVGLCFFIFGIMLLNGNAQLFNDQSNMMGRQDPGYIQGL
jgi:hypothetical protein